MSRSPVPIGPVHLGNKYYTDRDYIATSAGPARVNRESTVRCYNGNMQEEVGSKWTTKCPKCYRTIETEDGSEEAREELFDSLLACCDIEWIPPSDYIETCEICGGSHRLIHDCTSLAFREGKYQYESDTSEIICCGCEWEGTLSELGSFYSCPTCGDSGICSFEHFETISNSFKQMFRKTESEIQRAEESESSSTESEESPPEGAGECLPIQWAGAIK